MPPPPKARNSESPQSGLARTNRWVLWLLVVQGAFFLACLGLLVVNLFWDVFLPGYGKFGPSQQRAADMLLGAVDLGYLFSLPVNALLAIVGLVGLARSEAEPRLQELHGHLLNVGLVVAALFVTYVRIAGGQA